MNNGAVDLTAANNLNFFSGTNVASNSTVYLSGVGQLVGDSSPFINPTAGQAIKLIAQCNVAPGAGQTFTYTLRINGVDTPYSVTISGAGSFSATSVFVQGFSRASIISLKLVTSTGANAASHRAVVVTK